MEGLYQRYSEIKRADDIRNALIEDLLQKLTDMHKTTDRNTFAMVLIDGDCMNFIDDLVQQGIAGGGEAAKRLRQAVFRELRYDADFKHDQKIVIRVYANLRGLSKTYADHNILPNAYAFSDFVLGFNKAHPLCDFIDAGNHKEAADKKIQETLNLYIYNVHCKQIIFGASADSSYASFLNSFDDPGVSSRVRLLKGPPFPFEYNSILPKFKQVVFEDVFRSELIAKLPAQHHVWRRSHRDGHSEELDPSKPLPAMISPPMPWQPKEMLDNNNAAVAVYGANDSPDNTAILHEGTLTPRRRSASPTSAEVEAALICATNERLKESPKALDFAIVKQRTEQKLGLPPNFWGKTEYDEWFNRSKNVIKWATEDWVERTDNPPPKNATWMLHQFPDGESPSAVLKHPVSRQWRTKGNPEWVKVVNQLIVPENGRTNSGRIYQYSNS